MDSKRLLRHLTLTHFTVRRAFAPSTCKALAQRIRESEAQHAGQLRLVIEGALDLPALWRGQSARDRALELFAHLGVWDTPHNNGVLVYVLMADRGVEIVADRGIDACCGQADWNRISTAMAQQFASGEFEQGTLQGLEAITRLLAHHFPPVPGQRNDLPDSPILL